MSRTLLESPSEPFDQASEAVKDDENRKAYTAYFCRDQHNVSHFGHHSLRAARRRIMSNIVIKHRAMSTIVIEASPYVNRRSITHIAPLAVVSVMIELASISSTSVMVWLLTRGYTSPGGAFPANATPEAISHRAPMSSAHTLLMAGQ